jgi:hypothetical protein
MPELNITDELAALIPALLDGGVDFAVCGGVAVTILAQPRMTKDIDLLAPTSELDRMRPLVLAQGFSFEAAPMTFDRGTSRERTIRRFTKIVGPRSLTLDVVLVEPSFLDVWRTRIAVEWLGRRMPVVSREGLATMKRMANRAQDRLDLELLELANDATEQT